MIFVPSRKPGNRKREVVAAGKVIQRDTRCFFLSLSGALQQVTRIRTLEKEKKGVNARWKNKTKEKTENTNWREEKDQIKVREEK